MCDLGGFGALGSVVEAIQTPHPQTPKQNIGVGIFTNIIPLWPLYYDNLRTPKTLILKVPVLRSESRANPLAQIPPAPAEDPKP